MYTLQIRYKTMLHTWKTSLEAQRIRRCAGYSVPPTTRQISLISRSAYKVAILSSTVDELSTYKQEEQVVILYIRLTQVFQGSFTNHTCLDISNWIWCCSIICFWVSIIFHLLWSSTLMCISRCWRKHPIAMEQKFRPLHITSTTVNKYTSGVYRYADLSVVHTR